MTPRRAVASAHELEYVTQEPIWAAAWSRAGPRGVDARRPRVGFGPSTGVRRGPLLAARYGRMLGLTLLRAGGRILVRAPPPTHRWLRPVGGGIGRVTRSSARGMGGCRFGR